MFKIVGTLPVKTRLPFAAWALAGLVTLFSIVTSLTQVGGPMLEAAKPATVSAVSTYETDLAVLGREDFWLIVAFRGSEDEALRDAWHVLRMYDPHCNWGEDDPDLRKEVVQKLMDLIDNGVTDPQEPCRKVLSRFDLRPSH